MNLSVVSHLLGTGVIPPWGVSLQAQLTKVAVSSNPKAAATLIRQIMCSAFKVDPVQARKRGQWTYGWPSIGARGLRDVVLVWLRDAVATVLAFWLCRGGLVVRSGNKNGRF
jgi:hypothetical protein